MTRFLPLLALVWAAAPHAQVAYGEALPGADVTRPLADGARSSLAAAAGPAGLVVVFWSTTCPWTDRYAPRLAELIDGYGPAGFGFVLVDSAPADAERQPLPAGLAVPVLLDPDRTLASAFGAAQTPHSYLFGPGRTLLYDGAMDDSPASPLRVRTPYLARAMDQSVAGLPVEIQRTQAFGCSIDRAAE